MKKGASSFNREEKGTKRCTGIKREEQEEEDRERRERRTGYRRDRGKGQC